MVGTSLLDMYAKCCDTASARKVFDNMPHRNAVSWNAMIAGYFKKGDFAKARGIFDRMGSRNLVNWNSLISGYAQNGMCEEAFEAFKRMRVEGFDPDEVTVTSVLSACGQSGMLDVGKEIHNIIRNKRIKLNEFVLNGLIDMYAKCGDLENAKLVFESMPVKNTASWNSLITGFAIHGRIRESIAIFEKMEDSGVNLDSVTFLSILSACAHGGFVETGLETFSKMVDKYGIEPNVKHYGCLVDLLGRAGKLEDAFSVVKGMPMGPNDTVLGAMLGACRIHSDTVMAENVIKLVGQLDSHYVLLSNIYAESERWEMAEAARVVFSARGIEKTPGCSALMI
ncbi:pentatricopeptide repeat-containing protein at3g21470 [Phtheirospermum japonicum]|uniref:Pentatricopeptide repeat-containing protein at3g21470 n=1 Tax=Phtheirospermum japonicum TaxID=374723 RepID=A0A830B5C9_9LAMI|nr:pentatricopeptide repeat-containing protein at3g21470 [Phtheirospermum japonicum]